MNTKELTALAGRYTTPCYVFDCDMLKQRVETIREKLGPETGLCYAMKANPFLTAEMARLTDRIEVCSPGEMRICIKEGICPDKILLSGVSKTEPDVREAFDYGVRHFTAESPAQMRLLEAVSRDRQTRISVYPRLCSGSQFGMDLEDLMQIICRREEAPFCEFRGIHYFAGTQRKAGRQQEKDVQKLEKALTLLKERADYEPEEIEYGPGLFFAYFEGEEGDGLSAVDELREILRGIPGQKKLTVEMGRYFAAECGYFLSRIVDRKKNEGKNYLIIDGGIHHLNYYGGMMGLRVPHFSLVKDPSAERNPLPEEGAAAEADGGEEAFCICGSLCTTADVVIREALLTNPLPGDLLIFENTGAYSVTESSALFLSRDMPLVLMEKEDKIWVAREVVHTASLNH